MLLCCEYRCLCFIEIGQRLKDDEIGTRLLSRNRHFAEKFIGRFKGERAKRLDQLSDGTDIERNTHPFHTGVLCRTARNLDICPDDFGDGLACSCKFMPVRSERIAVNNAAARGDVVPMNFLDHFGMLYAEELGALARRKPPRLQLCPHPTVQYNNVFHSDSFTLTYGIFFTFLRPLCTCAQPCGRGSCGT